MVATIVAVGVAAGEGTAAPDTRSGPLPGGERPARGLPRRLRAYETCAAVGSDGTESAYPRVASCTPIWS